MPITRPAARPDRYMSSPRCTCRGYDPADPCGHGDTSEGCPVHDPRLITDRDNVKVMWCLDCRNNTIASRFDDDPVEPWGCERCGADILCDVCGTPLTDDHDEDHR